MMSETRVGSKLAAFGLLLVFLAALGGLAIVPHLVARAMKQEAAATHGLALALDDRLRNLAPDNGDAAARSPARRPAEFFIAGETRGIAAAELQNRLTKLIRSTGGEVRSLLVVPPAPDGEPNLVSIVAMAKVRVKGLSDVLHTIETSTPLLFVDHIRISMIEPSRRGSARAGPAWLEIEMQVSGFRTAEQS